MSLLLDALKKAADDKERSSRDSAPGTQPTDQQQSHSDEDLTANPDTEETASSESSVSESSVTATDNETLEKDRVEKSLASAEELTLDLEEPSSADGDAPAEQIDTEVLSSHEAASEDIEPQVSEAAVETTEEMVLEGGPQGGHHISSEALSLLIDKTNHEVKKGNRVSFAILFFATTVILLSGGVYFYTDMQTEIATIERKHQIAMQSMRTKTNREETPQQSAIIKNLVSDAELEEKVEYAKAQMENVSSKAPVKKAAVANKSKAATAELSITRTNKVDPVAERLDAAWLAYDDGRYEEAEKLYTETLELEENNRDALLGLGAIAVVNKDDARARQVYLTLLEQDPRDPIATAALSGLSSDESSLQDDNKYLMSMLEKNPDTPHLNFSVANNFAQQGKWKSAQQYYFKAWQYDIDNADYLFNLAVSMEQLDKPKQALGFYRDSLIKANGKQVSFSREAVQRRIDELTRL